jgi:hypothetical protein
VSCRQWMDCRCCSDSPDATPVGCSMFRYECPTLTDESDSVALWILCGMYLVVAVSSLIVLGKVRVVWGVSGE